MKLVIFDLDGVIVSTDDYHFNAWNDLAKKNNLLFNRSINHKLRGVSRAESLNIILSLNGRTLLKDEFDLMLKTKNDIYKESLVSLTSEDILPGVLNLLKSLKENNIKIAIGSSSKNAPKILEQIGLYNEFDIIVDGNSIKNSKPDPEVFVNCAKGLGIDCKECVVFEDANAGIKAALNAGMFAVGVGNELLDDEELHYNTLEGINYDSLYREFLNRGDE